jgi:hypothetical protein
VPPRHNRSARGHCRAGDGVVGEVIVNVDCVPRVGILEGAGNSHHRAELRGSASRDSDLSALDVELRDSCGPRVVDGQGLDTEEVVPIRDARGDVKSIGFCF